jgi:uncharacterized membrane protein YqjE
MLGSAREFVRTLVSVVETRTRLAASELEEQAVRFTEIALWTAGTLFFFGLALVFISLVVVLAFWESNRLAAAGLLAGLYLAAGAVGAWVVRARLRERPPLLSVTLAELRKDREHIERAP